MAGVTDFASTLLHKTVQRMPLRSSINPEFKDLRRLEYQIRKETPNTDRFSLRNVVKDFYARHILGPKSKEPLTDSIPSRHRRSIPSNTSISPLKTSSSPLVPSTKPSLFRSKSVLRAREMENFEDFCEYAKVTLGKDRERMELVKGRFVRRIKRCEEKLKDLDQRKEKGKLPKALLEHRKRLGYLHRSKSGTVRKETEKDTTVQEVVQSYRKAVFRKAGQSNLSLQMRYVYTMGTTSARNVPDSPEKMC